MPRPPVRVVQGFTYGPLSVSHVPDWCLSRDLIWVAPTSSQAPNPSESGAEVTSASFNSGKTSLLVCFRRTVRLAVALPHVFGLELLLLCCEPVCSPLNV